MYEWLVSLLGAYARQFFTVGLTQLQFVMAAALFAVPFRKRKPRAMYSALSALIWLALLALSVLLRTAWPGVGSRLPVMGINVLLTLPMLFLWLDEPPFSVLSTWCAAVAAEEIVATIYDFQMLISGMDTSAALLAFSTSNYSLDILLYILIRLLLTFAVFWALGRTRRHTEDEQSLRQIALLTTAIVVLISVLSSLTYEYQQESPTLYLVIRIYSLAFAFVILVLRSSIVLQGQARAEMETMEQVMREQRKQYEQNRESIQLINMRCHDLKHQLANLAGRLTDEEVRSLQEAMNIYDGNIRTGNEVLDVVLYENQLTCQKERIQLSCMADGQALSFMRTRHIYALFSNALRNAIEAVRKLEEERRIISVNVDRAGDQVEITVSNYCPEDTAAGETLPTSKGDRNHHGFGTQSMRYIAQQYGGTMATEVRNGMFTLSVILPVPKA